MLSHKMFEQIKDPTQHLNLTAGPKSGFIGPKIITILANFDPCLMYN